MILPLPRVLSGSVLRFVLKLRADGPLQSPQTPDPPKHKDPKWSRAACAVTVSGGLGLQVKDQHQSWQQAPPATVGTIGGIPRKATAHLEFESQGWSA